MASATFTVNGGASAGGTAVSASSTVNLALASSSGVASVAWSFIGSDDSGASYPTITLGDTKGLTASFPVGATAESWLIRCVVNGSLDENEEYDASLTATALIGVALETGVLLFCSNETTERSATHGWTEAINAVLQTDYPAAKPFYYGSGLDGNVTISSGTTTLLRDMFYNNLTISGTGKLNTAGCRVHVAGTLDISGAGAGAIFCDGSDAPSRVAAAPGSYLRIGCTTDPGDGGLGGTGAGANGSNADSSTIGLTSGRGGAGGDGQTGNGGLGGQYTTYAQTIDKFFTELTTLVPNASTSTVMAPMFVGYGGGGGAAGDGDGANNGGNGGGGGSAGRCVWISAFIINRASGTSGIITANGGAGHDGYDGAAGNAEGGGGGGGGSGGLIFVAFGSVTGTTNSALMESNGGDGGAGGNGVGSGTGGEGGTGGGSGLIMTYDLTNNTTTRSTVFAGAAGSAESGGTGGAGGAGDASTLAL